MWVLNDSTIKAIRKLKDSNGQYLWQPSLTAGTPDTILGRPVRTSAYMPAIAASAKTIAFGDFSYYWIADRQGRSFKRLNELYAANGQVGFLASQRRWAIPQRCRKPRHNGKGAAVMDTLLEKVKANLILEHSADDALLQGYITAAVSYAESYQHIQEGYYTENAMPATTEQAVIMLASHFYESRDGSTGGFFADNVQAGQQVWNTVNLLLRLDRDWKV